MELSLLSSSYTAGTARSPPHTTAQCPNFRDLYDDKWPWHDPPPSQFLPGNINKSSTQRSTSVKFMYAVSLGPVSTRRAGPGACSAWLHARGRAGESRFRHSSRAFATVEFSNLTARPQYFKRLELCNS